jgi:hypothetical protein
MYARAVRERALHLLEAGWSLNSVSKELGVSRAALREWRDHGIEPRGRPRACSVCGGEGLREVAASYALLLGYYLGDGCISKVGRTYCLRVSCDRGYPGIIADVDQAIRAVHRHGRVCHVPAPGVTVVKSYWNHWPCLFPQHGPGRKHERKLQLVVWRRQIVNDHPGKLLRGLFWSDGCRVNNWATGTVAGVKRRYEYPRWQFVNHSADIRQWCTEALDLLEIPWRQSNWMCISVSTRAGVARLDELVGPKH